MIITMSTQTPTRILILWKRESHIVPWLRQTLDQEASKPPTYRLDNSTLKSDGTKLVPNAVDIHATEFGLSPRRIVRLCGGSGIIGLNHKLETNMLGLAWFSAI
jgi:hypothetical protein